MKPAYSSNEFFKLIILLIVVAFIFMFTKDCKAQDWQYVGEYYIDGKMDKISYDANSIEYAEGSIIVDILLELGKPRRWVDKIYNQSIIRVIANVELDTFTIYAYKFFLNGKYKESYMPEYENLKPLKISGSIFIGDVLALIY